MEQALDNSPLAGKHYSALVPTQPDHNITSKDLVSQYSAYLALWGPPDHFLIPGGNMRDAAEHTMLTQVILCCKGQISGNQSVQQLLAHLDCGPLAGLLRARGWGKFIAERSATALPPSDSRLKCSAEKYQKKVIKLEYRNMMESTHTPPSASEKSFVLLWKGYECSWDNLNPWQRLSVSTHLPDGLLSEITARLADDVRFYFTTSSPKPLAGLLFPLPLFPTYPRRPPSLSLS